MNSLKQALIMGVHSSIAVFAASYFGLPTWVLFMAWVSYYLFGTTLKTAFLTFTQQVFGILIAMGIQFFSIQLSGIFGIFGAPIVVFILLTGVFYVSKLKYLNTIPAYFLGMIIWFGTNTGITIKMFSLLIITLLLGYFFAWSTVMMSARMESK